MGYKVEDLYKHHARNLGLKLICGSLDLKKDIVLPEVQRPGLTLVGFLKHHEPKRILVFGKTEIEYLKSLSAEISTQRLDAILTEAAPCVIITETPPTPLKNLCEEKNIPLFRASLATMELINKLTLLLVDAFSPTLSCPGTFVEVFGIGMLIQGASSIGKSEVALMLVQKGHGLICDDVVKVRKKEGSRLEGFAAELSGHHMEIRDIGIINIAKLFGPGCIRENKSLDIVVKLEVWDDSNFYQNLGLEEKTINMLGVEVPYQVLAVKSCRDIALLLETLALNFRLKKMGYHSAKEFKDKLLSAIEQKGHVV